MALHHADYARGRGYAFAGGDRAVDKELAVRVRAPALGELALRRLADVLHGVNGGILQRERMRRVHLTALERVDESNVRDFERSAPWRREERERREETAPHDRSVPGAHAPVDALSNDRRDRAVDDRHAVRVRDHLARLRTVEERDESRLARAG